MFGRCVLAVCIFILVACVNRSIVVDAPNDVDRLVITEMAARHIPGLSLGILRDGKVVYLRAYGTANLETGMPARDDTVYAIGSITKSMTAIALMQLQERGRIDLDQAVSAYVENLPEAWRSVTLRQLLANTSGIPEFNRNPCKHQQAAAYGSGDVLVEAACLPLNFTPGARFEYSNTNFVLLSVVIEHVSNQTLSEVFSSKIFTRLGMLHTRMLDYVTVIPQRADGYLWTDVGHVNVERMDVEVESGAGGVISTTGDMLKFVAALGGDDLLTASSWKTLFTPYPVREGTTPYALGFGISSYEGHRRVGHNGAAVGFASAFSYFPDDRVGIILLTNGYEEPHGRSVSKLANDLAAAYFPAESTGTK